MKISIIAAIGNNHELGLNNKLPWFVPRDMLNFMLTTLNHHILMGRNTYLSLGRPLPNRTNMILSHDPNLKIKDCYIFDEFENAYNFALERDEPEFFIIGGSSIYELAIPVSDRMYLSRVDYSGTADTFFPQFNLADWNLVEERHHPTIITKSAIIPSWNFQILDRIKK